MEPPGLEVMLAGLEGVRDLFWCVNISALHKLAEWTKMNTCGSASVQLDVSRRGILAFHLQVLNGK